ncbi:type II secretion system protein [Chitinimonas sp. BJYL2]|uniref:type II secretion system protein n=1 Tax=Chitinimonas sp. BJYL2 TaxID=2976696 RepID=UPI0022B5278F|nr:type II secretion system protein [Chitinimonas sp. BJYL2]
MKGNTRRPAGFTLIEMAVTMVIIGLLMGGAMQLYRLFQERAVQSETQGNIAAAREALIGFAAANGRLPRHDPATDEFTPLLQARADAWGGNLVYVYDPALATPTTPPTNLVCGRRTTAISVRTGCDDAACAGPTTISNVAFMIVSRGNNTINQTVASQSPVVASPFGGPAPLTPVNPVNIYNRDVQIGAFSAPATTPTGYDDVVSYITLEELRQRAGCTGQSLSIQNNELPFGIEGTGYTANLFANGGIAYATGGSYRWCIQTQTGTLPSGLSATTVPVTTAVPVSSNCDTPAPPTAPEPEANWARGNQLTLTGTPSTTPSSRGSYALTIFVRDDNDATGTQDNVANRNYVLTINPN